MALYHNPGGATLGGTLSVTAQNGVATFSGLTLDNAAFGYTLIVSGTGLNDVYTDFFDVTALAATQFVVTAQPPPNVTVDGGFGLTVSAEDPFGNPDLTFDATVAVALLNNPGGATLGGTLSAAAQGGIATFSGLTLDQPGTGYTLQLSTTGFPSDTTQAFNAGFPTGYTVDLTSANGTGSGNSGDLVYVVGLANANTNPFGSEIQFDPTVFASPQTITLGGTLELSETAGPEVIDGPGADLVTVSGNTFVLGFLVDSSVTATLAGLTISGCDNGGIENGGTTTVTNCTIAGNGDDFEGAGGGILNGGTMTVPTPPSLVTRAKAARTAKAAVSSTTAQ